MGTKILHSPHGLPEQLPPELRSRLRAFVRQRDAWQAAGWLAGALLLAAGVFVLGCALDRVVDIAGGWRLPFPVLTALAAFAGLGRALVLLLKRPDYDAAALALDRADGDSRDHLRSALDFSRRGLLDHPFARRCVETAGRLWAGKRVGTLIERKAVMGRLTALVAVVVLLMGVGSIPIVRGGLLCQRFWNPLGNYMRPTAAWFEVTPPGATPLRGGDDFTVRTRLKGVPVTRPAPLVRVRQADGATLIRKLERQENGEWTLALTEMHQGFSYTVMMGAVRSARFDVPVVVRPEIIRVEAEYDYPKYARMKNRTETLTGRTLTALDGTKVKLTLTANLPLREVQGAVEGDVRPFTLNTRDARRASRFILMTKNEQMELRLTATNGLAGLRELPFNLRVMADNPPSAEIVGRLDGRAYYAGETLEVGYRAQDDVGLAEISLKAGDYLREAEFDDYGAREAQGVMKIPMSELAPSAGEGGVLKLRLIVVDTKGQQSASRETTVRVALNSYDRQLAMARGALTGGHVGLGRQRERLATIREIIRQLGLLQGALADGARPGVPESSLVGNLNNLGRRLDAGEFAWIMRDGGQLFRRLAGAEVTPRLNRVMRDAVCTAEMAVGGESMSARIGKVLADGNPKAPLGALASQLQLELGRPTQVVARLEGDYAMVQVETAGYLAANLRRTLEQASADQWTDRDFLIGGQTTLRTLAQTLADGLTNVVAAEAWATLQEAAGVADETAALRKASPVLGLLVSNLTVQARTVALAAPAEGLPFHAYLAEAGKAGKPPADLVAMRLVMESDDVDADELMLLQDTLHYLAVCGAGAKPFTPVGNPDPGHQARQAAVFRMQSGVMRLHGSAEALRIGVAAGYLSPGQPEFEALWLRLRESAFDLQRLQADPALSDGARKALSGWAGSGLLNGVEGWLPDKEGAALVAQLVAVAQRSGIVAQRQLPEFQAVLKAIDGEVPGRLADWNTGLTAWRQDLQGTVGRWSQLVDPATPGLVPFAIYDPLPRLRVHLGALQATVYALTDLAEAARIHHAGDVANLDRLVLASVFMEKAGRLLDEFHGRSPSGHSLQPFKGGHLNLVDLKSHADEILQIDRLLGELQDLLARPPAAPDLTAKLREHLLAVAYDRERGALNGALGMESSLTGVTNAMKALLGERTAAPAVWGHLYAGVAALTQDVGGPAAADGVAARAKRLAIQARCIDPLPKDLQALPEVLDSAVTGLDEPGRRRQVATELESVLGVMKPLAAPVTGGSGKDRQQARMLPVHRERATILLGDEGPGRAALYWEIAQFEWNRRKQQVAQQHTSMGGIALMGDEDLTNLKLPKHLYQELKRAREQAMPTLFTDRCYQYLNSIMENAR